MSGGLERSIGNVVRPDVSGNFASDSRVGYSGPYDIYDEANLESPTPGIAVDNFPGEDNASLPAAVQPPEGEKMPDVLSYIDPPPPEIDLLPRPKHETVGPQEPIYRFGNPVPQEAVAECLERYGFPLARYYQVQVRDPRPTNLTTAQFHQEFVDIYSKVRRPEDAGGPIQGVNYDAKPVPFFNIVSNSSVGLSDLIQSQRVPSFPGSAIYPKGRSDRERGDRPSVYHIGGNERALILKYPTPTGPYDPSVNTEIARRLALEQAVNIPDNIDPKGLRAGILQAVQKNVTDFLHERLLMPDDDEYHRYLINLLVDLKIEELKAGVNVRSFPYPNEITLTDTLPIFPEEQNARGLNLPALQALPYILISSAEYMADVVDFMQDPNKPPDIQSFPLEIYEKELQGKFNLVNVVLEAASGAKVIRIDGSAVKRGKNAAPQYGDAGKIIQDITPALKLGQQLVIRQFETLRKRPDLLIPTTTISGKVDRLVTTVPGEIRDDLYNAFRRAGYKLK